MSLTNNMHSYKVDLQTFYRIWTVSVKNYCILKQWLEIDKLI